MAERGKPMLSFGFKKSLNIKRLNESKLNEEKKVAPDQKDFILAVEEQKIHSTLAKKGNEELVIPLTLKNKWCVPRQAAGEKAQVDAQDESLEAKAAREIIQELKGKEKEDVENSNLVIPVFIQNKVPDGYETKDKLDVSLRAEEPTQDDYDRIPIDQYGLAMLRGMGWKKGDPIGSTNKQVVQPIEAVVRPKGLGLGADPSAAEKQLTADAEEDIKNVARGTFVRVQQGTYEGLYGQVEGFDDDGTRLLIKLAIGSRVVSVVRYLVQRVSQDEYKDKGKLLNEKTYEKRKSRYEESKVESRSSPSSRDSEERSHRKSSHRDRSEKHAKHKRKRDTSDDDSDHHTSKSRNNKHHLWIRPQIKVRFINKKFKDGRYFNTKMVVVDVVDIDAETCILRTEHGKLIDDVHSSWLETVIPRNDPLQVMVVKGKHSGQLGLILDKDKAKCKAVVQLLGDRDVVFEKDYDSVCEYVGDAHDHL